MRRSIGVLVGAVLTAAVLAGCSSDGSDGASSTTATERTTTTQSVEAATAAFCTDARTYIQVLSDVSDGVTAGETTVGDLKGATEEAKRAADAADASKDDLIAALEAAAEGDADTGGDPSTTSTTLVAAEVAEAHLQALTEAQTAATDAIGQISDDTLLSDASATVRDAAFTLQVAWISLYSDAGCLTDDAPGAQALHDYVVGLQTDLAAIGLYTGPIDGIYSPETIAAVKALQERAGLTQTGYLDPASQLALQAELAKASKSESLAVAAIQGALRSAGFYDGPVDGVWSPALEEALAAYQADQEATEDSTLDPLTLLLLLQLKAQAEADASTTTTEVTTTTTEAPTTAAPTTVAPTTVAPTTEAPTTEPAPSTTIG